MELLYVLIVVLFITFVITCIVGIISGIVRYLWPVLLILGIYYIYRRYKNRKYLENNGVYTEAPSHFHSASEIFDADYEVKNDDQSSNQ